MRKLYALLAGFVLILQAATTHARPVVTPDAANFTFTVNDEAKNVVFTNTSVLGNEPGRRAAHWTFGDGTGAWTGPLQGTQHHYQHPGTYTVCLKIYRYRSGNPNPVLSAQICKTVVVNTVCKANFVKLPFTANNPLRVLYKAIPGHNDNKRPIRICWNFGDGSDTCINYTNSSATSYSVVHTYNHPGLFEVCVKILYAGGCEARKCKPVRIGNPDSCRADFERIPLSTNNPLDAAFKALPWNSNNLKPQRICWNFGDGSDTCIEYPATYTGRYGVFHHYDHPGLYEVCVKIKYYGGCESRKCKNILIGRPDSCSADFERIPASANTPLGSYFRALPWHNNNKKPQRICWNFGDGNDTCINYPSGYTGAYAVFHQYQTPGLYEVCVKINYYGGCESRKCKNIQIGRPDSCSADFERLPISAATPLTIGFRALPWHNNNKKPQRICWNFGDGTDTCINYTNSYTGLYGVEHRYQQPGQYEVCVRIIYYGGCESRKCRNIEVPPPPVTCSVRLFEITPSITSLVRGFLAVPHSTPPRRPVSICWVFGDGDDTCIMIDPQQPLPDFVIRHTYPGPGVYRACVRVRFEGGCLAYDCKEVVIRSASNVCGGYMVDSLIAPRTYKFKGFSINVPNDEVISYRWVFGDGSVAVGREVTHTYPHGGDFETCLFITTRLGCETRVCKVLRVPGNNQAQLVLTPNPVVNTLHAAFFSTHTEPVMVRILNNNGTVVRSYVKNATVGPNNWDFDVSSLIPGLYSCVVQSPNQLASAIFIKQ